MNRTVSRLPEIDLLRTIAIIGMIIYHTAFDLQEFYGFEIEVFSGFWKALARVTAILFLSLVGISFFLSAKRRKENMRAIIRSSLRRSAVLLMTAYGITVVTFIVMPEVYIRFGILHLIGISVLLLPFFLRFGGWNILIGSLCVAGGYFVKNIDVSTSLLLPIGVMPKGFITLDYFPLFPWFGVILFGLAIGYFLYGKRNFEVDIHLLNSRNPLLYVLTFPGKYALAIYVIHQPVILFILWVFLRT